MEKENIQSVHWADITADKIIRERKQFLNDKKTKYVCASGITPSGTVHIGNFREIISVELVVRALRQKGADVRFIYSWDDYDVFRKVPKNMPNQEELAKYLRPMAEAQHCAFLDAEGVAEFNKLDCMHLTRKGHAQLAEKLAGLVPALLS